MRLHKWSCGRRWSCGYCSGHLNGVPGHRRPAPARPLARRGATPGPRAELAQQPGITGHAHAPALQPAAAARPARPRPRSARPPRPRRTAAPGRRCRPAPARARSSGREAGAPARGHAQGDHVQDGSQTKILAATSTRRQHTRVRSCRGACCGHRCMDTHAHHGSRSCRRAQGSAVLATRKRGPGSPARDYNSATVGTCVCDARNGTAWQTRSCRYHNVRVTRG